MNSIKLSNKIRHYLKNIDIKNYYFTSNFKEAYLEFPDRDGIKFSVGKLAKFADGSVQVKSGETSVLVTAVSKQIQSVNASFLPLTVDYRQKAAAAGRIPTNFLRRDRGFTEHEILVSRLIDRSIRPLFSRDFLCETQIICNLLSVDGINDPDILCINAASAALSLSNIPWNGPIGAVRIGKIDDNFIINPTRRELANSALNLVVSSTPQNNVVMLEASAEIILQQDLLHAIRIGIREGQKIIQVIQNLQMEIGKEKRKSDQTAVNEVLINNVQSVCEMKLKEIFLNSKHDKLSRDEAVNMVRNDTFEILKDCLLPENTSVDQIHKAFNIVCREIFRNLIFENNKRCDGRGLTDLRSIDCEVDLFKPVHGSSIFQRGQTQVLSTISLDSPNSVLHMDPVTALTSGVKDKNFFLHYEFPPYATKEIGKIGPALRREVGHGALAERALRPVVPQNFPFTVRLSCEVLESNGSSSMASVCGGSLALLDAGVPLLEPAAGVAVGLVTKLDDSNNITDYRILVDLLGIEDYMGDMDFKIAGTKKGITALQADVKIPGIPIKILMEAIQQGYAAKRTILNVMNEVLSNPRIEKKDSWPVTEILEVPITKRNKLLGYGGMNLKKITITTGAQITINDDNTCSIFAPNQNSFDEAIDTITKLISTENVPQLEFGGVYPARIVEMRDYGVMVTLYDSMTPTLLHNSQLDQRKVSDPKVLGLEVGQEILIKYFGIDPVSGQMRLSRKVLTMTAST